MKTPVFKAQPRAPRGTKAVRALRAQGMLPLVIYGHGEPPESAMLPRHEVEVALAHGARTLELELDGAAKPYLIKQVQYDHLDRTVIHLDLARVDLHERVIVPVAVELRGVPRGVSEGGILDQLMASLDVECTVTDIPGALTPLVTHLGVGDALLVRDLELPTGVKAQAEAEEIVAIVRALVEQAEPEPAEEAAEETAEPERIGRVRKEEGVEGGQG